MVRIAVNHPLWYDSRRVLPGFSLDTGCSTSGCGVMISLQQVLNSSLSLRVVSALAQNLSPQVGYRVAALVARQLARQQDSQVVRAIRANQWVIRGETLRGEALDCAVAETLQHAARCIFDLYHYMMKPDAAGQRIVLEPSFQRLFQRSEFDRRGLIIIGLHMSNFDLVLHWVSKRGLRPLAVTIPSPRGGRRLEYEMRKRMGITLLPASVGALRQAIKHLQKGGMLLTGMDRPISDPEVHPRFFNRPAALPLHHIFLATKAHVPLAIAITNLREDGKYHVSLSNEIELDHHADQDHVMLHNAEQVLKAAEPFIRRFPGQWSVPLPVWPELIDLVPQ